ncbi:MAG: hypothetical protein ACXWPS_05580, partial [Ktedonobacteraceae bacterium]
YFHSRGGPCGIDSNAITNHGEERLETTSAGRPQGTPCSVHLGISSPAIVGRPQGIALLNIYSLVAGYWTVGGSRYGCANCATQGV